MKSIRTYISEGFYSNVGANNIIKPAIDAIKDASMNNKIDSDSKRLEFVNLLTPILKDIEADIKKGKLAFEYIRNDVTHISRKITISLEIFGSNNAVWIYSSKTHRFGRSANDIAFDVAMDLYYETKYPPQDPELHHSIANTIKVIEFKVTL